MKPAQLNECAASVSCGLLTLEDGRSLDVTELQSRLYQAWRRTDDPELLACADSLALVSGTAQDLNGNWVTAK